MTGLAHELHASETSPLKGKTFHFCRRPEKRTDSAEMQICATKRSSGIRRIAVWELLSDDAVRSMFILRGMRSQARSFRVWTKVIVLDIYSRWLGKCRTARQAYVSTKEFGVLLTNHEANVGSKRGAPVPGVPVPDQRFAPVPRRSLAMLHTKHDASVANNVDVHHDEVSPGIMRP